MRVLLAVFLALASVTFAQDARQTSAPIPQEQTNVAPYMQPEIAELLRKAEGGDAKSQVAVGRAYADGNGLPQSFEQALTWYHKAADQGNAQAENEIGILYRTGNGVERNKEEALNWYRKGASHGSAAAMFNVGVAYYNGDGTFVSDERAYAWFLAAEDAGDSTAREAANRSASEVNNLHQLDAYLILADMYRVGKELPKSDDAAAKWYRKAADAGSLPAQVHLAAMMVLGQGDVHPDYAQARQWCEGAAKQNYSPGAFCMGLMYRTNALGSSSETEAAKWFSRAAELGNASAMFYLGRDYWKGNGVKLDKEKGYEWLLLARSAGSTEAEEQIDLIRAELTPEQIKRVEKKAMHWSRDHSRLPTLVGARP